MKNSGTGWTEGKTARLAVAIVILVLSTTLANAQELPQAQPLPPPPPPPQLPQQPQQPQQPPQERLPPPACERAGDRAAPDPGDAAAAAARARGILALDAHARAHLDRRRRDPDRHGARLRHRVEHLVAGHRLRGRRRARHHPDQPARGDARAGQGFCDLPEPRGGRARARLPRSGARLRLLSLRPVQAALHPAGGTSALSRGRADRRRDPRRRQRRRRAAVDPRGHARAARPPGAGVRSRPLQRLQHVLLPGGVRHLRRLVRLAGPRHPRPRARA